MIDPKKLRSLPELLEERMKRSTIKLPDQFENEKEWQKTLAHVRQEITILFNSHEDEIKRYMIMTHHFASRDENLQEHEFTPEGKKEFLGICEGLLAFRDVFLEFLFFLTRAHEILSSHPDPLALGDRAHLEEIKESYQKLKTLDLYRKGDQQFIETLREFLDQCEKDSPPK